MHIPIAVTVTLDGAVIPAAVAVLGFVLVYVTWALRGLLKAVRSELEETRQERNQAREEERELRKEVGRLRRVVSALIRVIADAGLPVPDEAYDAGAGA